MGTTVAGDIPVAGVASGVTVTSAELALSDTLGVTTGASKGSVTTELELALALGLGLALGDALGAGLALNDGLGGASATEPAAGKDPGSGIVGAAIAAVGVPLGDVAAVGDSEALGDGAPT